MGKYNQAQQVYMHRIIGKRVIYLSIIRVKRKNYVRLKIILIMVMITSTMSGYFIYLDRKVVPIVLAIGELKAQELTTRAINESVRTVLKENIRYEDLISTKEDLEGNISMMQANTFLMNRISADLALTIQDYFTQIRNSIERIPLGNILGSQFFAHYGPKINLSVTPYGMVDVNFATEFEHAGINQTRHRVFLIINTEAKVMVPFNSNNIHVTTYYPVAETIIVGKVPHNYINVPQSQFLDVTPIYE